MDNFVARLQMPHQHLMILTAQRYAVHDLHESLPLLLDQDAVVHVAELAVARVARS